MSGGVVEKYYKEMGRMGINVDGKYKKNGEIKDKYEKKGGEEA